MSRRLILDARNVIIRTKLVILSHELSSHLDTDELVDAYGFFNLLVDLVHYGGKYRDLPGNPHYAEIAAKLETLHSTEIDREYLDFVLAELEYTLYTLHGVSWTLLSVQSAEYPIIVAGGAHVYS